jgi:hypothetical protein
LGIDRNTVSASANVEIRALTQSLSLTFGSGKGAYRPAQNASLIARQIHQRAPHGARFVLGAKTPGSRLFCRLSCKSRLCAARLFADSRVMTIRIHRRNSGFTVPWRPRKREALNDASFALGLCQTVAGRDQQRRHGVVEGSQRGSSDSCAT